MDTYTIRATFDSKVVFLSKPYSEWRLAMKDCKKMEIKNPENKYEIVHDQPETLKW